MKKFSAEPMYTTVDKLRELLLFAYNYKGTETQHTNKWCYEEKRLCDATSMYLIIYSRISLSRRFLCLSVLFFIFLFFFL